MIFDRRCHRQIGGGFYADVFAVEDRAYKLFKNGPEVPPRQTTEGRRRIFERQCEAFRTAAAHSSLRNHVAQFVGIINVADVIDGDGLSVGTGYLLDCCYAIELFGPGHTEAKATAPDVRWLEHIDTALQQFRQLGINALDSSVFDYADSQRFKFIDIEMMDR
jgi:hypothetical protein